LGVATIEEAGDNYHLKKTIEGITGDSWLRGLPLEPDQLRVDPDVATLKQFFDQARSDQMFLSGLWPSHLILKDSRWNVVNHHGVRREKDDDKLKEMYRTRMKDSLGQASHSSLRGCTTREVVPMRERMTTPLKKQTHYIYFFGYYSFPNLYWDFR